MAIDPRTGAAPLRGDDQTDADDGDGDQGEPTISAPVVRASAPPPPYPQAPPSRPPTTAPVARATDGGPVRYEARQVHRIVTRVEPWSVLKVSLLFAFSTWLILVVAGVVLWRVAVSTGTISKFENFMAEILAEPGWVVDGMQIFRASAIGALVLVVTGMVFAVVFSVLFNLIAGLTGGLRVSVIELETARRAGGRRSGRR
ncbi:DUF3566 domain-containing protein [Rhabdothermincola salaria]|uniref:DUF3566 domain-containing protein n=1 Tax=Rhabdothermincola salaria TaxID=2903142 RepID=UPI001E3BDE42|nr:DUF3566 domain-containing protein [Rhabdothermincola salaria]MCD9624439.1 DUF3566 domain-containing protein [Rhabdothermincola salaria]